MPPSLPPYDPKRQADAVVRAFQYQFLETAIAWLELGPSETLLVEVAEDFDIQSGDGGTTLTQVTHASNERRLTLASEKSREAMANYWAASSGGTDPSISLVLHTNMAPGQEVGCSFPGRECGIGYWVMVQAGADPLPLRDALKVLIKTGPLLEWLNTDPDGNAFSEKLVHRITWRMAQQTGPERSAMLTTLLMSRLSALGLPAGFATNATKLITYRVLEIASDPEVERRSLTASDLNSFLNESTRPGQPGHEAQWGLASWTAPLDTLPLPRVRASRDDLVRTLALKLKTTQGLWLHGASGTGKTTLAQQTAVCVQGNWLLIDFRNQEEPSEILLRLERAYTDVTLAESTAGVILDDLRPDLVSSNAWRFARFLGWLRGRFRHVIVTSAQAPSPALTVQLGLQQASVTEAPYLAQADVAEMARMASAPDDMLEAWALFIHTAAAQGHPQITAAKVASLEYRSWPADALTEDLIGRASEAVVLTRSEARQRLLREATNDSRALLKRLACIFLRFDRAMAIAAASVDPEVPDPSASLDFLIGPWIEQAPGLGNYFRLSPLLFGLNEDVSAVTKRAVQQRIVVESIQSGPIPFEALDVIFWNAIFSEQGWFFTKFFEHTLSLKEEVSAAFASKLSTIVVLTTDRPILPSDPGASVLIRLMQLDVAAINRDERVFQSISEAAVREAGLLVADQARQPMRIMVLSKILFAQGGRLDWVTRLKWIEEYDALSESDPHLANLGTVPAVKELKDEFGDVADLPGFLLTIGLQTIQSPDDLSELFDALDNLHENNRRRWLEQLRAYSMDYYLYVQGAWANAWFGDKLNAATAVATYERMGAQAQAWSEPALAHQCTIAQSVLWDEILGDRPKALAVIERAIEESPGDSALLRQKAKVLGHQGDFSGARTILASLQSELRERSSVDQLYTLKEEAVAAARLGDFEDARRLFIEAANVGDDMPEEMRDFHCHKIALRAEGALCAWWMEERSQALIELAEVLHEVAAIEPGSSDVAWTLHAKMRWLVRWIDRSTRAPQGEPPPKLVAGAMSALDDKVAEDQRVDRGPFDDVKLLLLISACRCAVPSLPQDIDWSATTPSFHLMLVGAEFDLVVESRRPELIATAVLNIASGFLVASESAKGATDVRTPLPIRDGKGITLAECLSEPVRSIVSQLIAVAAFRLRRDVPSIRALAEEIVTVLVARIGFDDSFLRDVRVAISGGGEGEDSHAGQLISTLLAKGKGSRHPALLIQYHLNLVACASVSGAGARTARDALNAIAEDWAYVVERHRFLLAQPSFSVPRIQTAIERVRRWEPGALSELLEAAAKSLNAEIPEQWLKLIKQLGGTAQAQNT